ncbi:putative membrane protein [Alkalispirillum mobile]|uniref:Putative membrane protein n=2 Tax=Alkalispirillum mobile TaxID=85925 RepID=A0A498C244_9GAMM|nr:putative membrane protein [Alkalispirillum mobile]
MTEQYPRTEQTTVTGGQTDSGKQLVMVVYILYLVGFFVVLTAIAGLILAYIKRGEADPVSASHYQYQIRTFWIGVLYSLVGIITSPIGVGFLIMVLAVLWFLTRCIKGLVVNSESRPITDPTTWLW